MIRLTQLLKEVLNEVGDKTSGYPWQLDDEESDIYQNNGFRAYSFLLDDDDETIIGVFIGNDSGMLTVEFQSMMSFESVYPILNKGVQFKIMGTIVNIIRRIIDRDTNGSIKGIKYSPIFKAGEPGAPNYDDEDEDEKPTEVNSPEAINKRDNLYRLYIQKAFPEEKVQFSKIGRSVIALFPKKKKEINELGNSSEGYPLTRTPVSGIDNPEAPLRDYRDEVKYTFQDDEGNKYWIKMYLNTYDRLSVSFNENGAEGYKVTNRGKQYKIVSTVANAIENEIELDYWHTIQGIEYEPAYENKDKLNIQKKRAQGIEVGGDSPVNARDTLYRAFISKRLAMFKKLFPNAQVKSNNDSTIVDFNRQKK